ncbi:MAG: hypothetical protein WDM90_24195 [Ferruginibacter sp.]
MNNITIAIVPYEAKYQPYFEKFNRHWIEAWFTMEPLDEYVLTNPEEAILKDGGAILMALYNGECAGTVGLRKWRIRYMNLPRWLWTKISGAKELQKH